MTTPLTVAVVLSPRPWSIQLHSFVADHVPDIDIVVVRDRRAAFDAKPHVLVIDDASPWLTQSFVSDAELAGIRLVGVYDRADSNGRDRLVGLGLTHLIEEAMPPEDVVFLLDRLRPSTEFRAIGETRDRSASTSSERGSVIAVGGPSGSGARELAVALAATWGPARSTLLVDCNETTPGVARRLGLTPYPHILTAIDRCHSEGLSGIDAALADQPHRLPFDAVAGLATPRDWDRLIAHDLIDMLDTCRDGWERVVVTTSPLVEDLQRWGDRFGVSRAVLRSADVVVGSAEPTPRGTLRYLDWLSDIAPLRQAVMTIVNKVPKAERVAAEVSRELVDVAGDVVGRTYRIPFDRRVTTAEWDGTLVGHGPFAKAVAALSAELDRVLITERLGAVT
jgi:hypothetical protein